MNRLKTFLLPLTVAIVLAGCGGPPAPGEMDASGVLIYGSGADATTLDPADAEDGESAKVIVNVFDTLLTYPLDSAELVPGLATEWTESADRLQWTFKLREGVKFHDGTPFNADAVIFTMNRLINPEDPNRQDAKLPYGSDFQVIEKVTATGPLEVVFHLKRPSGVLLRNLAMFAASIVSPAAFESDTKDFKVRPVGTGPFRFEEWIPNEKLSIVADAGHWRGPPGVGRIIFKPITESAGRLRQLRSGEIDIADGLSIPIREQIKADPSLKLLTSGGMNIGYLGMNMTRPPFDNINVRKAIAHAIDKQAILASAYDNAGVVATTPIPRNLWGFDPDVPDYPFDPGKSRELLAEAGIKPGTKVHFWAMRNSRPYMPAPEKISAMIQQQLREVGLEPEIESPPWTQYLDQVGNGEHEMCLMGWSSDNADPNNFLYNLLDKDHAVPPNANNNCFYKSEPLHEILIAAQEESDQGKRTALYQKGQRIIHEDCPMVPLVSLEMAAGVRKRVTDYQVHPTGIVLLRAVKLQPE